MAKAKGIKCDTNAEWVWNGILCEQSHNIRLLLTQYCTFCIKYPEHHANAFRL